MRRPLATGYGIATLGVLLGTGFLWLLRHDLTNAHIGLVYLLFVASAAAAGGTRPAIVASFLSFLLWDFLFLAPFYTFFIYNPNDWILLIVYLIIGLLIGQITGTLRRREEEAHARERDASALYRAIQAVATEPRPDTVLATLVDQVRSSTGAVACAMVDEKLQILASSGAERVGEDVLRFVLENARAVGLTAAPEGEANWPISVPWQDPHVAAVPLATQQNTFGVLYARFGGPFGVTECRVMVALASQAATYLERLRLLHASSTVASEREAERLRNVLFSSISHNLKTPLASLNATLSSLREEDVAWTAETMRDALGLMAVDIDRLTTDIEKLLSLAQLEAGSWEPQRELYEPREIVTESLQHLGEAEYRRISIDCPAELPMIWADPTQLPQAVRHLVENALEYSVAGVQVVIGMENERCTIAIDDAGPGVPEAEREAIFHKFYRGSVATSRAVRGSGLGLPICRAIVTAHGGSIRVGTSPVGGARFTISLPLAQQKSQPSAG